MSKPIRIAITPGEPAGIGPELVLKLGQLELGCEIVAVASIDLLEQMNRKFNLGINIKPYDVNSLSHKHSDSELFVIDVKIVNKVIPGQLDLANAGYVIDCITTALNLVKNNKCDALTTGPVQKSMLNEAGITFTGHTEFIAEKIGGSPVMMLTKENNHDNQTSMRVALVTTHVALKNVAKNITKQRIEQTLTIIHQDLRQRFKIPEPRICVCGLNPHAGEDGHLGKEELEIILPTLEKMRKKGMLIDGPVPADTAFTQANLKDNDVIVAMYHDQGLPVIKHSGFGEIVNVTLGLPIIRTSVDHGTALDIAGQGTADVSSLCTAVKLAAELARNR